MGAIADQPHVPAVRLDCGKLSLDEEFPSDVAGAIKRFLSPARGFRPSPQAQTSALLGFLLLSRDISSSSALDRRRGPLGCRPHRIIAEVGVTLRHGRVGVTEGLADQIQALAADRRRRSYAPDRAAVRSPFSAWSASFISASRAS